MSNDGILSALSQDVDNAMGQIGKNAPISHLRHFGERSRIAATVPCSPLDLEMWDFGREFRFDGRLIAFRDATSCGWFDGRLIAFRDATSCGWIVVSEQP